MTSAEIQLNPFLEAAGGRIQASNRVPTGARFEIELPIRER